MKKEKMPISSEELVYRSLRKKEIITAIVMFIFIFLACLFMPLSLAIPSLGLTLFYLGSIAISTAKILTFLFTILGLAVAILFTLYYLKIKKMF